MSDVMYLDTNEAIERTTKQGKSIKPIGVRITPYIEAYNNGQIKVEIDDLDTDLEFIGRGAERNSHIEVGVEFKACPSDFLGSYRDGRIPEQLIHMVNSYDISYLVLVGEQLQINFENGKIQEHEDIKRGNKGSLVDSPFTSHYINSTLSRFEAAGGHMRIVPDIEHLAAFLISLYRFWTKEDHKPEVFIRHRMKRMDWGMINNPMAEIYERMLIGPKNAMTLTEVAPTIQDLAVMSDKDLVNLPGFGRKTMLKIRKIVGSAVDGQQEVN